jgi:antitoxin component YwqK of YwqJK toxin-antitoxin module
MKKELTILTFLICSYNSNFGQNKPSATINNDSILYIKEQIDDSTIFVKETVKNEGVVKLTRFSLIDSIWVEISSRVLIDGKVVKLSERNRNGSGVIKEYAGNGTIISITEIQDNLRHGEYLAFYVTGTLKEKGSLHDALKIGEWLYFSEDGKTISIENYTVKKMTTDELMKYSKEEINNWSWNSKDFVSLKHGAFKVFHNGNIIQNSIFENGRKIK